MAWIIRFHFLILHPWETLNFKALRVWRIQNVKNVSVESWILHLDWFGPPQNFEILSSLGDSTSKIGQEMCPGILNATLPALSCKFFPMLNFLRAIVFLRSWIDIKPWNLRTQNIPKPENRTPYTRHHWLLAGYSQCFCNFSKPHWSDTRSSIALSHFRGWANVGLEQALESSSCPKIPKVSQSTGFRISKENVSLECCFGIE